MTAALPVLMAYSLAGETLHECIGTAMLALFIAHHILNRKATASMFRGKQTPVRILGTVVNLLLFVVMVCLPISGIVLSKHLYTWLPTDGLSAIARTVHLLLSYWGFVLMSFHLGLHADLWLNRLKKREAAFILLTIALSSIWDSGPGCSWRSHTASWHPRSPRPWDPRSPPDRPACGSRRIHCACPGRRRCRR